MSNLSQDAIDALLRGEEPPAEDENTATGEVDITSFQNPEEEVAAPESDIMSREQTDDDFLQLEEELLTLDKSSEYLTEEERDILGEIGNICMGTAATTMYTILDHRVTITTPEVRVYTSDEVLSIYRSPFVAVKVEYTEGVDGKNLLILKEYDTALITDLLMGGEGNIDRNNIELNEMHLSAISEIMNQMIGSSATSLASMLGISVNISPPEALWVEKNCNISDLLDGSNLVIKISFDMVIEGVLKSKLMQLMSVETGKRMTKALKAFHEKNLRGSDKPVATPEKAALPKAEQAAPARPEMAVKAAPAKERPAETPPVRTVDVKPLRYESFDEEKGNGTVPVPVEAMERISDIPLQVAVELGKTKKSISDILGMGIGSVIVLDKMAGELVEVIVNGKQIARGEVVVIDENYGVRITDVLAGHDRFLL